MREKKDAFFNRVMFTVAIVISLLIVLLVNFAASAQPICVNSSTDFSVGYTGLISEDIGPSEVVKTVTSTTKALDYLSPISTTNNSMLIVRQ
jgi:hypothetical protein